MLADKISEPEPLITPAYTSVVAFGLLIVSSLLPRITVLVDVPISPIIDAPEEVNEISKVPLSIRSLDQANPPSPDRKIVELIPIVVVPV